jgi:prepilin-type N-terminal cleavage/methylation domain-containing protein
VKTRRQALRGSGFTLIELLVVICIVAVLVAMAFPVFQKVRLTSWRAASTHTLQQLSTAGAAYRADHDGEFWRYREPLPDGTAWWFGFESSSNAGAGEGNRKLDLARGPLGPYVMASSGVKSDPAFASLGKTHKPKFANGTYGFGYNGLLGGGSLGSAPVARMSQFTQLTKVVVFATSAQVNTFQSPATAKNPMIEEFYLIDATQTTVHFRYGGKALAAMLDGSIAELPMDRTTVDKRMPSAKIGRFAPVGSKLYLAE